MHATPTIFVAAALIALNLASSGESSVLAAFSLHASAADNTRRNLRFGNDHDAADPASHTQAHLGSKSFYSQAVHGAYVPEGLGSVIFPIYQASTFRFESVQDAAECAGGESDAFIYTR